MGAKQWFVDKKMEKISVYEQSGKKESSRGGNLVIEREGVVEDKQYAYLVVPNTPPKRQ